MTKEKLLTLWKVIEYKCSKYGLIDTLEMYELSEDDWDWLEHEIYKLVDTLED